MDKQKKIRAVFMGTPDFAVPALEALIKSDFIDVIAVITNPDRPVGRKQIMTPPPIKQRIMNYESRIKDKIKILQPDRIKKPEWVEKIKELNPELIIVAAFGQIIPKEILDIPKYKTLNVHGSLLPQLRGPSPIPYAILEGHKKTGNTIMLVDEQMDHGQILAQKELQLTEKETSETLFEKMAKMGANLLMETLPLWIEGKIIPQEQNHSEATYCKIITREDGKIDWQKSAEEIERQIRAFTPWPGTFCFFKDQNNNQKRLKILEADVAEVEPPKIEYGLIFTNDNSDLLIQAGKDCLKLIKVQPEGKNPLTAEEFINGYRYLLDKKLL